MPRKSSPRLDVGYGWLRGEDWWGDPMSDNLVMFDALFFPYVETMTMSAPPVDTVPGQQFIVGPEAAGLWLGYENAVATRYADRWMFVRAFRGLRVFINDLNDFYWFDGVAWAAERDRSSGVDPNGHAYDLLCSVGYPPEPMEVLLLVPIPETMTLPQHAVGSLATALAPPPDGTQVLLQRNGVQIGQVLFPSNDYKGTITVPADITFARGDRLTVMMTNNVPADFGNFSILLRLILPPTE